MSGELVIDREATSGSDNRHFYVKGTLELEDVTLKGGHGVSSFVLFVLLRNIHSLLTRPIILLFCD